MRICPIFLKAANKFVVENHDHHEEVVGHIFSIGLKYNDRLIGVAICGRPTAPKIDYKTTIEVTRLCVLREPELVKNACSKLYSACARIAREMGYEKITTCVLQSESGVTLRASGWFVEKEKAGGKNGYNSSGSRIRTNVKVDLFGERLKSPE